MPTEGQKQQLTDNLRQKVREHGLAIVTVFGDENTPSYGYTIGLSAKGLPEIFIAGAHPEAIGGILNDVGRRALKGEIALTTGEPKHDLIDQFMAVPMPVMPDKKNTLLLVEPVLKVAPRDWEAVQLVWPDTQGRFPWSEDADDIAKVAQDFGLYIPPSLH